jgi:hypothetical protein
MDRERIDRFHRIFENHCRVKYNNDLHCLELLESQVKYFESELENEMRDNAWQHTCDDYITDRMIEDYKEAAARG